LNSISRDLLQNISRKYSTCQTYQDEGIVKLYPGFSDLQRTFKTYFVRPEYFRFEWITLHSKSQRQITNFDAIWSDGRSFYCAFDENGGRHTKADSLRSLIVESTGISSGTSRMIACLLLPELGEAFDKSVLMLDEVTQVINEKTASITGTCIEPDDTEIEFERDSLQIREIKTHRSKLGGKLHDWTTDIKYTSATFNCEINKAIFKRPLFDHKSK